MFAGLIRYFCILLVAMALVNAPVYTSAEIAARAAYMHETYGGGQGGFSGDLFPGMSEIQEQVLKQSFIGASLKNVDFINSLFINVKPATASQATPSKPKATMTIGGKTISLQPANSAATNPPKK
jgi:hypothetical protein